MTREEKAMYLMRYAVRVLLEGEASAEDKRMAAFVRSIEAGYLKIKISKTRKADSRP